MAVHAPERLPAHAGGELLLVRRAAAGRRGWVPSWLTLATAAIALAAVLIPALMVTVARPHRGPRVVTLLPTRVVPRSELPPVEPVRLVDLAPEDARAFNAGVPFSAAPNPAARPFRLAGTENDRARATDCLAAAVLYEAGDDAIGERAVAQVVLNRLRHPAFPKTVCGVVFEGSDRSTGCQFTFSCDGALERAPSPDGWRRAREIAAAALSGAVYAPVGLATHYHTDWVVPYWQASLDKIAAVHTHLFFRWAGWWGTPRAFDRAWQGGEPVVAKLASLSDAHRAGAVLTGADGAIVPAAPFMGRRLQPLATDPDTFVTALDPAQPPESYRALALSACGERAHCKVLGWTDVGAMGFAPPFTPEQTAAMSFSYLRDKATGFDKALWNCAEFPHAPAGACMKRQPPRAAAPASALSTQAPTIAADAVQRGPDELVGVRRRAGRAPATAPAAEPTPTPP